MPKKQSQNLAIYCLAALGIITSVVGFGVLYLHPSLADTPHQRLIISAAALGAFSAEMLYFGAGGRKRLLPEIETQRRETILRFQIYGVAFVIGFCLAIEDHLLLAVAGFASLAVAHQVLVSWKYWRRRLILFLVTSLVAPQGFTFILRQLGVDISTMSGSSSAVWAVCFLVAIMWFFPGSEE